MKIEQILKLRIDSFNKPKEMENPCWKGYEPVGLKPNGDPNCVKMSTVQEGFPIPSPVDGEDKQEYISRCMKVIGKEYDTPEQALAVCYSQIEKK